MDQIKQLEQLEKIYKDVFSTSNGKAIISDLENFILKKVPFFTDEIEKDCLLREGARQLLTYIYCQLGDNPTNKQ